MRATVDLPSRARRSSTIFSMAVSGYFEGGVRGPLPPPSNSLPQPLVQNLGGTGFPACAAQAKACGYVWLNAVILGRIRSHYSVRRAGVIFPRQKA